MGYTTEFYGKFELNKPIDQELAQYINRFSNVRHMKRDIKKTKLIYPNWKELCYKGDLGAEGEYLAIYSEDFGQEHTPDIIDYNRQPSTQPGLWCDWIVSDDLESIEWNGMEKFYDYDKWLIYIIDNFLKTNGYILNGEVEFQGEDEDDSGYLIVEDNNVSITYKELL